MPVLPLIKREREEEKSIKSYTMSIMKEKKERNFPESDVMGQVFFTSDDVHSDDYFCSHPPDSNEFFSRDESRKRTKS